MLAYIIVGVDVHDAPAYAAFANEVPATLEPFGGRFLVRGGAFDVIEGAWPASRIVVLEFPSSIQAGAWLDSAAYQAILPIRHRYGETHFTVIVDRVPQVVSHACIGRTCRFLWSKLLAPEAPVIYGLIYWWWPRSFATAEFHSTLSNHHLCELRNHWIDRRSEVPEHGYLEAVP